MLKHENPETNNRAFFDLQVNGYAGVDFNSDGLTAEMLHSVCERMERDGVEGLLATIITDDLDKMASRLANLVRLREESPIARRLIYGLHIEGPFLSPETGYRGAHPAHAIRTPNAGDMSRLLDAGAGLVRLVTLAPEYDNGQSVTKMLVDSQVVVSAGHCNPSLNELSRAIDAGLSMFTHLGNATPMLLHRHDNIIQRALSLSDRLWVCFIADGAHIAFPALSNYLRAVGPERAIVVTDAVAPAGLGPGRYQYFDWDVTIGEDLVAMAPDGSHLIGSVVTMPKAFDNLRSACGLTEEEALRLTSHNPRRAITGSKEA
ncbi:MAG: N-acetylglucosamine-6-phosphate deacetylase [Capsulimonas sp.]|nr:N-acetylglucosamine-6-phosphate deacetylase [Capsulimonas sp.]